MKFGVVSLFAVLFALIGLVGCSSARQIPIRIPYEDFVTYGPHQNWYTTCRVGDTLVVTLGANPTTGFKWPDIAQISNRSIVEQTDHKSVPPDQNVFIAPNQSEVVGASGKDIWTFKATKKGLATVLMTYVRPSEGVENEWTFKANITIE